MALKYPTQNVLENFPNYFGFDKPEFCGFEAVLMSSFDLQRVAIHKLHTERLLNAIEMGSSQ